MSDTGASKHLDDSGRRLLFTEARTVKKFSDKLVTDAELEAIWALARWPPTSLNCQPLRIVFVRTADGKNRLVRHMNKGNVDKAKSAPVTAILASDRRFHEQMLTVFPTRPELQAMLEDPIERRLAMADFNATLQAAYFLMAVRANGLCAGPMTGFDSNGVDREFFPDGQLHAILAVNIGYPGDDPWIDRLPRLPTDDVIRWA